MTNIQKTDNYKIFNLHERNRPILETKVKKLINSIRACNLLEFRPIVVDAQMRVIDGQHRLEAAKVLGLEVYYQINEAAKDEDMIIMQLAQSPWEGSDFFHYYVTAGNDHYIKADRFMKDNNINFNEFCALTGMVGGHSKDSFKRGKFTFPEGEDLDALTKVMENLDTVMRAVDQFAIHERKLTTSSKFKRALISFLRLEEVNPDQLVKNIRLAFDKLHLCANIPAYFLTIQDVYNFRNRNPLDAANYAHIKSKIKGEI